MTGSSPTCSRLEQLNDFGDYIDTLKSETQFGAAKLRTCKAEICNAIYGNGNPDISGIGVCCSLFLP